jgi:hypothetical protein
VSSLSLAVLLNGQLSRISKSATLEEAKDSKSSVSFRWHPNLYRILSSGHVPSSVDWLLIRFLVDSNIAKIRNDEETEVFRILDLATELDPAFFSLYAAGANYLTVVKNDRVGARRLLEKGRAFQNEKLKNYSESFVDTHWADRWRIGFILGYVYLFEFQDLRKAAEVYDETRKIPGIPTMVRKMAERIQTPKGQFNIGLNVLSAIRQWHEEDETMLKEIDRKVLMFELARDLFLWNETFLLERKKRPNSSLQAMYADFRIRNKIPERDRFGGEIYLREDGRIDTRTERVPVLGVEIQTSEGARH